jgi:hypothetical protein
VVEVEAAAPGVSLAPVEGVVLESGAAEVDVVESAVIEVVVGRHFDGKVVAVDPVGGSLAAVRKLVSAPPYTSAAFAVAVDAVDVAAAADVAVVVVEGRNWDIVVADLVAAYLEEVLASAVLVAYAVEVHDVEVAVVFAEDCK